jgi:argininosuccinate lyase
LPDDQAAKIAKSKKTEKAKLEEPDSGALLKGRLSEAPDPALLKASASIDFDYKLAAYDVKGSMAHAKMLEKSGLISHDDLNKILAGLKTILSEILEGRFTFDPLLEDVHMNVEKALTDLIGPVGAKLHAARSRNDQVVLDERLFLREKSQIIGRELRNLREALLIKSEECGLAPMPGYTHLQRAQPVLLAHHLMAYYQMLSRDQQRLNQTKERLLIMPLGSGALAGTGLPIEPQGVADDLEFTSLAPNSLDAVSSRDFLLEFLSFSAILMVNMSRLAEDIVLWCTSEFNFATLPDSLTTTSSMMPQKKNPDGAELIRGKAGRTFGNLMTLLTTLKGLPLSYNRDLQEDKEPLFDTVETLETVLPLASKLVCGLIFNLPRLREAANDGNALATDLAERLVLKGVAFRKAHEIVGSLAAFAAENGQSLRDLSDKQLKAASNLINRALIDELTLELNLQARRTSPGGTSPETTRRQMAKAWDRLRQEKLDGWL